MSDSLIQATMRETFGRTLEGHPEWPNHLVAMAWDAIDAHDYRRLDEILARLDRLTVPRTG